MWERVRRGGSDAEERFGAADSLIAFEGNHLEAWGLRDYPGWTGSRRLMGAARKLIAIWLTLLALACPFGADAAPKPKARRQARRRATRPPRAPRSISAVRVAPGVIGIDWSGRSAKKSKAKVPAGYLLYRAKRAGGPYRLLAKRPGRRPYFLDAKIEPATVYYYKVSSYNSPSAPSARTGPTCAWDSDQLAANGSFDLDKPGLVKSPSPPLGWSRRAYNSRTPLIVKPGGPDGARHIEIQSSNQSVGGGVRSALMPMIEGETWYQEAWAKALPGASPRVGRCFYGEDKRPVRGKGVKRAYDYAGVVETRPDGWGKRAGVFTAPPTTCYVQLWLIGFRARNTYWFDGATVVDRTAQRFREFDLAPFATDAARLVSASPSARRRAEELKELETKIAGVRKRMKAERLALSPLDYRRLFVALDRTRRAYADLVWKLKTLALLEK